MHEEPISQAEIDALVRGLSGPRSSAPAPAPAAAGPAGDTASLVAEGLKEFAGRAAQALTDLAGAPAHAVLADVRETTVQEMAGVLSGPVLFGRATLNQGVQGTAFFGVPLPLALAMITQIYGGVAPSALDDSALGALVDGLTQMNHAGLTVLGDLLGRGVYAGAVEVLNLPTLAEASGWPPSTPVVAAAIDLTLGDDAGRFYLVMPQPVWGPIADAVRDRHASRTPAPAAMAAAPSYAAQAPAPAPQQRQVAAPAPAPQQPLGYQAARFPEMAPRPAREETRNIELLMDVSLQVTVELGRTRKQIRDVLSMGPGSVLELDKLAGEQVDVLVNGKLIAKGEVVVIDENYGVRITDIISPVERVQSFR
ncbi:MAG TPA: flagellar motor switch protein FliN [Symbiobacteriaceae bacterium]|nr:flagellar motor switch protein FliN [Symbiobacteriaceae bacterium]